MFNIPMTLTYNTEQALREHPSLWIRRREAVEMCEKFGVSEYKWRDMAATIPKFPVPGKALYNRDALIGILQG